MRRSARRAQALIAGSTSLLVLVLLLAGAAPSIGRASARASAQHRPRQAPPTAPMLPLRPRQLEVLLGPPGQWLPEAGVPIALTLLSGRPSGLAAPLYTAYIALQRATVGCGTTPARDHQQVFAIASYYDSGNLISRQRGSPFAGAQAGDYAASLPRIVVKQRIETRVCVWLGPTPKRARLVHTQLIAMVNDLFAASVTALPSAGTTAAPTSYTLDAVDVGVPFSYTVTTAQCGAQYPDASGKVPDGEIATESVALMPHPCAQDGSQFTFSTAAGTALGALSYSVAQAVATPAAIATLGGCELDPVAVTSVSTATAYVQAVGCSVGRLLQAPYQPGIPRGAVLEAQVDGGIAEVAPHGTAVDLVVNGS